MKRPLPACTGQAVKVYRNLHQNCISVMEKQLVSGHALEVHLANVSFVVSQRGREKCMIEKRKNVHAFAKGTLIKAFDTLNTGMTENGVAVTYNPYKSGSFYVRETGLEVSHARFVIVTPQGITAWDAA